MIRPLPAGRLPGDFRIEFFNDPNNLEVAYASIDGRSIFINDLPAPIRQLIDNDRASHPAKDKALEKIGYITEEEKRVKYISCVYGAYDGEPDYDNGIFNDTEFWPCPSRATCPVQGILCSPLRVGAGDPLTSRQVQILTMHIRGLLNKEIAGELGISVNTVNNHITNIQRKTGLQNKKELVSLAYQKNLAS